MGWRQDRLGRVRAIGMMERRRRRPHLWEWWWPFECAVSEVRPRWVGEDGFFLKRDSLFCCAPEKFDRWVSEW